MSDPIEVEVLEIDGHTPSPTASSETPHVDNSPPPWQAWQGKIRRLDSRWWPLWVLLGVVLLGLLLTVGVVVGLAFFAVKLVRGVIQTIIGVLGGRASSTSLTR